MSLTALPNFNLWKGNLFVMLFILRLCPYKIIVLKSLLWANDLSPVKQSSYLVYETALYGLFATCIVCHSSETVVTKTTVGSFISISQKCSQCDHHHTWNSQPFISKLPAGNILTAAAILYSGALLTQVLGVLSITKYWILKLCRLSITNNLLPDL